MGSIWKDINIKQGSGGAGKVTEEDKDVIISRAVSVWEKMSLTQEQMAFGIATMNIESGFNPAAKYPGPESTAEGLGQFTDPTWPDAVRYYNKYYKDIFGEKIYPDVSRDDANAQIRVMGAWIDRVWGAALRLADDPRLKKDYSLIEVAYGLWHQGPNAPIEGKKGVKYYLDKHFGNSATQHFLNHTYVKAHDALDVRDILSPAPKKRPKDSSGATKPSRQFRSSGSSSGETLRRDDGDYRMVWRIEPDGSTRGFFICND